MAWRLRWWLREAKTEVQGTKLEAGTKAEVIEEHCLLTCFSWLAQPPCLYQACPPRDGTTYSVLVPPIPISEGENAPKDTIQGQSDRDNSSAEFLSSQAWHVDNQGYFSQSVCAVKFQGCSKFCFPLMIKRKAKRQRRMLVVFALVRQ